MNATNSAQLAKCAAVPDTTCSARPRGMSGPPNSATATCTTKARWAGNRDWDALGVCTCLSPLRWTMLHLHGDLVKMLAVQAGRSPQRVHRFLADFSQTRWGTKCKKIRVLALVPIT